MLNLIDSIRPGAAGAHRVLWLVALALAAALWLHGPVAQWSDYHAFADRRAWLGIPNAGDVLSNIAFALVGLAGWRALVRAPQRPGRAAWAVFCTALIATAAGSAIYHWQPSDLRLVFDRIPIAWACLALVAAFFAERGSPRWSEPRVLGALLIAGTAAVLHWHASGDLRLYLAAQLLPILIVPAGLLLRLPRTPGTLTPDIAWWSVLACYAVAKLMEGLDAPVLHALQLCSGHTLKHLFAALGAALLLRGALGAGQLR